MTQVQITAEQVKDLRERSGAGIVDCKKALVDAKGDLQAAFELLRKAGAAKADKKSNRTAAEGSIIIESSDDNRKAVILELNCETDFVARDSNFVTFAKQVSQAALQHSITDVETLKLHKLPSGNTIEQERQALIAKLGENILLRRLSLCQTEGIIGNYIHHGRIGVLVNIKGGNADLAKDLAMHIAASNPRVVAPQEVPSEWIDKEREIFAAQAAQSGKPQAIMEKMIDGRIQKFLDEISLIGQAYIKDPNLSVKELLQRSHAEVLQFVRYEVGEGIEKKAQDFAAEVMQVVKGG